MLSHLLSVVPYDSRFAAACLFAKVIAPCLALNPSLRAKRAQLDQARLINENRPEDTALFLLLHCTTQHGVAMKLRIRIEGTAILEDALSSKRGVVIVGPHTDLSVALLWVLEQRSHPVVALSASELLVLGSCRPVNVLLASNTQLVRARSKLRQGATLVAYLNQIHTAAPRAAPYQLQQGRILLDDALLHVALACDASVFFFAAYLHPNREIVLQMGRPGRSTGLAQDYAKDLAAFVQTFLCARDGTKDHSPQSAVNALPGEPSQTSATRRQL